MLLRVDVFKVIVIFCPANLAKLAWRIEFIVALGRLNDYLEDGFLIGILNSFFKLDFLKADVSSVELLDRGGGTSSMGSMKAGVKYFPSWLKRGVIDSW